MQHHHGPGLWLRILDRPGFQELHITVTPLPGEAPATTLQRLEAALHDRGASVVRQEMFGSCALAEINGQRDWPVTWIEGAGCGNSPLAGSHVFAVADAPVETIRLHERPVGRAFTDSWGRHVVLGNLLPSDLSQPRPHQARQTFERMETALQAAGMNCTQLVRTWLFLDGILDWYDDFNAVRTEFYRQRGILKRMLPASTGIGAHNPSGASLVAGVWASQPAGNESVLQEMSSPLQGPAPSYGSSFTRAVELVSPDLRRVFVSGTASIAHNGHTEHTGNLQSQMDLTMKVARAILQTRGLDFCDVTRATAYVKRREFAPAFDKWRTEHGLAQWPVITTQADICRGNLLFEIELDAVASTPDPSK